MRSLPPHARSQPPPPAPAPATSFYCPQFGIYHPTHIAARPHRSHQSSQLTPEPRPSLISHLARTLSDFRDPSRSAGPQQQPTTHQTREERLRVADGPALGFQVAGEPRRTSHLAAPSGGLSGGHGGVIFVDRSRGGRRTSRWD
ncbi:hypothetical protein M758_3G081400 [Ceratodon purpureus]|uniref:Uncharacterized protein n=1 Tax=Ceratodon purpureus TaxID=3225 RepID=A0A8T0IIH3_CERPU|nr:hypothetical protein KC19_3G080100 [Ceratodon purpureus]KAG0622222.1 hypothetical protein M758_3G081400 [Ceratodon purpureus]